MDYSKCTLDNIKYKVSDFEKLDAHELFKKRRFLVCKSGQGACSGPRPHKDDCDLSSPENESVNGKLTLKKKSLLILEMK